MIKANEVRIGNLIMWNGEITKISALHIYTMFDAQDEAEEGSPIKLSGEILEKAGFDISEEIVSSAYTIYKLKDRSFMVAVKDGIFFYLNYCDEDDYYSTYWPELKTVHQLQNLYWCLCGEELNIKL